MSLFNHLDYRRFITEQMEKRSKGGRGEVSKMARAIGVHQTLMSLVLAGERDLSLEQGFELATYLDLTDLERDYFSLLIQYSRAGNQKYKSFIRTKIEAIRKEATQISKRIEHEKVLTDQQRAIVYSTWLYSAIRLYTSTHTKGRTLEEIQERFHLTRPQTVEILNFLESCGLVENSNDRYSMKTQRTFLEHGSPHLLKHHSNWRIKALSQADRISTDELMFTSPVSLSKEDFKKLREQMADLIKQFLSIVKDSPAEEIACLNIDFFWIGP